MAQIRNAADQLRRTLLLPQTRFPMRAQATAREPLALEALTSGLYRRQLAARAGAAPFVLHDGPPYANGSLHIGHALNKVRPACTSARRRLRAHPTRRRC